MNNKEIIKITGLSKQRLHQLREGHHQNKKGKKYFVKPKLIEGEDWEWDRGSITYHPSSLDKLQPRSAK